MLVSGFRHVKDNIFTATILDAAGISTASTIRDFLLVAQDEPIEEVTFAWNTREEVPDESTKVFLWHAIDNFFGESDFIVDDHDTIVLHVPERCPTSDQPLRFLELFAGGIGGWASAVNLLRECCHQQIQVVALEHDIHCAFGYAISHHAVLIDGSQRIAKDHFVNHSQDHIIHGDLWDKAWLPAICFWQPDIASISSPCQPWSSAATGVGLGSRDGLLLPEAIAIMKIIRPRILVIEQVGGFAGHEHQKLILRQLRWAGYLLRWGKSVDLQAVSPAKRVRWLAIAIRMQDPSIAKPPFQCWTPRDHVTPKNFDAVLQGSEACDERLQISPAVLQMAQDYQLLPPSKRKRQTREQVLQSRCTSPDEVPPCFMASYSTQHDIRRSLLETKGLFVHFFHDPQSVDPPRLWHPVEVLCLHSAYGSIYLPHDWSVTWKIIGNHIATPHALLLIFHALQSLPQQCDPPIWSQVMDALESHRWKLGDLFSVRLHGGVLMTQKAGIMISTIHEKDFFDHIQDDLMPAGSCWTLEDGFWNPNHIDTSENPFPNAQPDPEPMTLTPRSCASTEVELSGTQRYIPLLQGQLVVGTRTCHFWFAADVPMNALMSIWDDFYIIDPHVQAVEPFALRLIPHGTTTFEPPQRDTSQDILCLWGDGQLTVYVDDEQSMQCATDEGEKALFDPFGLLPDLPKSSHLIATYQEHFESQSQEIPSPQFVGAAAMDCITNTDLSIAGELRLTVVGPPVARVTMVQFWSNLLSGEALASLGLMVTSDQQAETTTVTFAQQGAAASFPAPALRVLLMVHAFRYLFAPMKVADDHEPSQHVRIRWISRTLWEGKLPKTCTLQVIMKCQAWACTLYSETTPVRLREFRIVSRGKQLMPERTIGECLEDPNRTGVTLNLIPACHGGGGPPTNKQGQSTQVKNSIAGSLLQEGYSLDWVSKAVDELVRTIGVKSLLPVTSKPQGVGRMQEILSLLKQANVEIPENHPKLTSGHALHQKQKRRVHQPSPKNYLIQDGTLLYQDGSVATQLKEFAPHHRGFYLASYEEASEWIKSGSTIGTDELAIIVFGNPGWETPLKSFQTTLPCVDEQMRQVLAAVTVFQLGSSHIKLKEWDDQKVATPNSTLVSLTLWKEEWIEQWPQIVGNPFAFIRNHLNLGESVTAMWGKSFKDGKQTTSPLASKSLQVHCSIKEDSLTHLLRESGHSGVWVTPKNADGKPCDRWKMIWLGSDITLPNAKIKAAKVPQACGLAKSGPRFAIRVPKAVFTASWKQIFPDTEPPEDITTEFLYKLEGLPFGVTAQALSQWATHLGWKVKPIRALGPKGWLVGCPKHPDSMQLAFNGMPLLLRLVTPRQVQQLDPILAGPRPSMKTQPKGSNNSVPLIGDPWARYEGPKPQSIPSSNPGSGSAGPVEQRMQLQDDRLSKIEEVLAQDRAQVKELQADLQKKDQEMRTHVDQRLVELRNEIDTGFSRAIQQQAKNFDSSMQELKQLLIQSQKRKTPGEGDEEM
eukprot:Skav207074  [mRNA]  locus=scaffold1909:297835:302331:+ [translate_table: standard]